MSAIDTAPDIAPDTAMIMAAGQGTRMRPLTDNCAKAMVTVGRLPLIEHMLRRLEVAGIACAVVNVHAHADDLETYLRRRGGKIEIIISDERDALLETGGGVVKALPLLGDKPFLICNIDAIWTEDTPQIRGLISEWKAVNKRGKSPNSLLMLAPLEKTMGYAGPGDFHLGSGGSIIRRYKAYAPHVFAGVEISRPENFTGYAIEKFSRTKVWGPDMSGIQGWAMDGHWLHVGDPQARDMAEQILRESQS